ncbi:MULTISPECIES: TRAP transporter small permease [Pseudomonas]|uniref:TRAP-type mannitol/chloroaromatic compound transport system permease small subunit n=1 Tax=Pseudomonas hunanensis TaxID=1247546 RepID=A0ACC6K6D7_9PSED|nr:MULTISPECIES: TRAP transporter small permease [Pseudomonas]MBP2260845.1 TRAP-type mannitol/chloroaromatic compound transport system permease small subunit [Pseudomonas sp. BP8]MDR6713941.1 TRAP-type mannitol/chloroaromatic compound transport system permease small subunit [Pseudomonas hunanensis]HDS1736164.1 TRAP transporter small permease [Pseudomonas putida]
MQKVRSGASVINAIAKAGTWGGGVALLGCAVLIAVDLILRKTIGVSMGGADEIAGYVLAITSAWAFPVTLLKRSHVRVDILYARLGLKTRVLFDLFALLCMAILVGTLLLHAGNVLRDSIEYGSISNTPLQVPQWIPQSIWFAGYLFFALTIVMLLLTSMTHLVRGRWRAVSALIGINSVEEEIQEELSPHPPVHKEQEPC